MEQHKFMDVTPSVVSDIIVREAVAVRLFLEERFGPIEQGCATASAGHCFNAAHLLAAALNDLGEGSWFDYEGIFFDDSALETLRTDDEIRPSDFDVIGQMHGFVISEDGIIVDVTTDQFDMPRVVISDNDAGHWYARYQNDTYGCIERGMAWIEEWRVQAPAWREKASDLICGWNSEILSVSLGH